MNLTYDELLSSFALKFNLHHYVKVFNPRKTVLLFVIRDKSRTPLEKLQAGGLCRSSTPPTVNLLLLLLLLLLSASV